MLPKQLRGAAGFDQSQYHGDHDDDELPMDLVMLPTATMVKYISKNQLFLFHLIPSYYILFLLFWG